MGLVRVLKDKAPVLVFSSLCAGAAYAVYYAHHQQIAEKKVCVIPVHFVRWCTNANVNPLTGVPSCCCR
ncbi:hypothetical protein PF005_g915 [Phytophthora fragariae]|uniref:Uncharacterized protein n=2 Tax=Phytophthora TaxID=4783 RepID=A0A6A3ZL78_9STRA|nr:hypothetical protein PF003_g21117 [Phytophthora fragariae]KAE9048717.1 hypothetical protein PR002_g295 [Phytophthora rubi]KAE8949761.1 hypothetical protein PF009_g684 [Phytophthora fragariae]KAE9026495.1 hypothetical protein PF011_g2530 [Phytophthora fragariae]KAE9052687.1 hypothetical protein PR001_g271 [Phytophthora rubi]